MSERWERVGWERVGSVTDLRDRLGLLDGAAAWEVIVDDPDVMADRADGEDAPWVVWIRVVGKPDHPPA